MRTAALCMVIRCQHCEMTFQTVEELKEHMELAHQAKVAVKRDEEEGPLGK